jgi:hypothetical protein
VSSKAIGVFETTFQEQPAFQARNTIVQARPSV